MIEKIISASTTKAAAATPVTDDTDDGLFGQFTVFKSPQKKLVGKPKKYAKRLVKKQPAPKTEYQLELEKKKAQAANKQDGIGSSITEFKSEMSNIFSSFW